MNLRLPAPETNALLLDQVVGTFNNSLSLYSTGASYVLILMRVYESEEKLSSVKGKQRSVTRKRVTRMVAVLVLCFGICWLPYEILLLLKINGNWHDHLPYNYIYST